LLGLIGPNNERICSHDRRGNRSAWGTISIRDAVPSAFVRMTCSLFSLTLSLESCSDARRRLFIDSIDAFAASGGHTRVNDVQQRSVIDVHVYTFTRNNNLPGAERGGRGGERDGRRDISLIEFRCFICLDNSVAANSESRPSYGRTTPARLNRAPASARVSLIIAILLVARVTRRRQRNVKSPPGVCTLMQTRAAASSGGNRKK